MIKWYVLVVILLTTGVSEARSEDDTCEDLKAYARDIRLMICGPEFKALLVAYDDFEKSEISKDRESNDSLSRLFGDPAHYAVFIAHTDDGNIVITFYPHPHKGSAWAGGGAQYIIDKTEFSILQKD